MENRQLNRPKEISFKEAMTEYEKLQEAKAEKFSELGELENTEAIENYLMLNDDERRMFFNINSQNQQKSNFKETLRYSNHPLVVKLVGPTPPLNSGCPSCVAAKMNYDNKFNSKWNDILDQMDLDTKRVMLLSQDYKDYIIKNKSVIDKKLNEVNPMINRLNELSLMFSTWYDVQVENKNRITKTQLEFLNRWFKFE